MTEQPEIEKTPSDPVLAEAVAALAASLLPEEVRERLNGKVPDSVVVRGELPVLLRQGFEQAGIGRTEVAMQRLQIEIEHLKEDMQRLERSQEKGITDSRVVTLVLAVMAPLLAAAYFLNGAIS